MHETGPVTASVARAAQSHHAAKRADRRWIWAGPALLAGLSACASMPQVFADIGWVDRWGDRGRGVLERDFGMCGELVESHRSLFADCMAGRGWTLPR